ncbi:hypothetical protein Tco_1241926, partial [Tanacetum coccineum]
NKRERELGRRKRIEHKQEEQAKEDLMDSIQSFLKKFSRIPFGETPKILLLAWEKFGEIKYAQQDDDESILEDDIPVGTFKTYSNPLFEVDEEIISSEKLDDNVTDAAIVNVSEETIDISPSLSLPFGSEDKVFNLGILTSGLTNIGDDSCVRCFCSAVPSSSSTLLSFVGEIDYLDLY